MSDAARSARPIPAAPTSPTATPNLVVVAPDPATAAQRAADAAAVERLAAALAGSLADDARVTVEVQATQRIVLVELEGHPDLYRLSAAAAEHGGALTAVTRGEGVTSVAVLLAGLARRGR